MALAIVGLWVASLYLPALSMRFSSDAAPQELQGYKILTSGWIGLTWLQPSWLANLVLLSTLLGLTSSYFSARFLLVSGIALIFLSLCSLDLVLRPQFNGFEGFRSGYFFWLAANFLAAGCAIYVSHRMRPIPYG